MLGTYGLVIFECKERELAASAVGLEAVVPAGVFKAGLNARFFVAIHFLKAHEDSYTFDAYPEYAGFLVHVKWKFRNDTIVL